VCHADAIDGPGKDRTGGGDPALQGSGDHLILLVNTTDPVQWKVRCTMTAQDMIKLLTTCFKWPVLKFILNPFNWLKKKPAHPGEF